MLVGLTRVRNEELIIADTIRHLLSYCQHVILYDDCSTDNTVAIAESVGGDDITIIHGDEWRTERTFEETRHRGILLERAKQVGAEWCLYLDADERLVGELPSMTGDGYCFRLFDGYLTAERQQQYPGGNLSELPRMWGPEFRDILMLFRTDVARYEGLDQREPVLDGRINLAPVMVKHFGKCLSVDQWEAKCAYYALYFPEPYSSKWKARKGQAIHTESDFGRQLYTWDELMQRRFAIWRRL